MQNDLVPVMAFHISMVLELVYFYLPPKDTGLPYLITQVTFLGVLNAITLIAPSGRFFEAFVDPPSRSSPFFL